MFTIVDLCFFTYIYPSLLVFNYDYTFLPLYRCLLVYINLSLPTSTCVYLYLHIFTYVYPSSRVFAIRIILYFGTTKLEL